MALMTAERLKRWRQKRNQLAEQAIHKDDTNGEIAEKIVDAVGTERALKLAKALPGLIRQRVRGLEDWNKFRAELRADAEMVDAAYIAGEITQEQYEEWHDSDTEHHPEWLIELRRREGLVLWPWPKILTAASRPQKCP
jgi:hypothetical protein